MEDLFKKLLYTGVGLVTITLDKVQKTVRELVDEGKVSENEGKKIVEDLVKDIESKKEDYETKLRGAVEKVLAKFDFPTNDEVAELKQRIAELETKLGETTPPEEVKAKKKDDADDQNAPA